MTFEVDMRSFFKGLRHMKLRHARVNYTLQILGQNSRGWWLCLWTPVWHEGRGPYISIGLGIVRFLRGY
jgi:hypothetical protein